MKVIYPVEITASRLVSSTVAEPAAADPAAWSPAVAYTVGQLAARFTTHRVYKRLVAGTTAAAPEDDEVNWKYYGPTLRYAMFDQEVNSQTVAANSLTVTVAPGIVSSLALLELVGTEVTITMTDGPGGATVYTKTVPLEVSAVTDWYEYFFQPFSQQSTVLLLDLPPYANCQITMTLTGPAEVRCGGLIVGPQYFLGRTQYAPSAGIIDYSRKVVDEDTGMVSLERRKYRKTMRCQFEIENGAMSKVHDLMTQLRSKPVVWIGAEDTDYSPLVVLGFYRDFSLDVARPSTSLYSLQIEGMT